MSTDVVTKARNAFVASEPVVALHLAATVVAYVLAALVSHGVLTHTQASAVTAQVVPIAAAGFVAGLGFVARLLVFPAARFADRVEAEVQARMAGFLGGAVVAGGQPLRQLEPVLAGSSPAPVVVNVHPAGSTVTMASTSSATDPTSASGDPDPVAPDPSGAAALAAAADLTGPVATAPASSSA